MPIYDPKASGVGVLHCIMIEMTLARYVENMGLSSFSRYFIWRLLMNVSRTVVPDTDKWEKESNLLKESNWNIITAHDLLSESVRFLFLTIYFINFF